MDQDQDEISQLIKETRAKLAESQNQKDTAQVRKCIIFDFAKTLYDIRHAQAKAWEEVVFHYPYFAGFSLQRLVVAEAAGEKHADENGPDPRYRTRSLLKWHKVHEVLGLSTTTLSELIAVYMQARYNCMFKKYSRIVPQATELIEYLRREEYRIVLYGHGARLRAAARTSRVIEDLEQRCHPSELRDLLSAKDQFSDTITELAGESLSSGGLSFDVNEAVFVGVEQSPEMEQAETYGMRLIFWDDTGSDEDESCPAEKALRDIKRKEVTIWASW